MEQKKQEAKTKITIGLDLGYSKTCASIIQKNHAKVIENEEGSRLTPTYIQFEDSEKEKYIIGNTAKNQQSVQKENTIYNIKKLFGIYFDDRRVQEDIKKLDYKVVKKNNMPCIELKNGKHYTISDLVEMMVEKMQKSVQNYLGESVDQIVLTVPVYYTDAQVELFRLAAGKTGMSIMDIIIEPIAACIAYGIGEGKDQKRIAVYDFGGSTFDVTILEYKDEQFEVLASHGDNNCGGQNIDDILIDHIVKEFKQDSGIDITNEGMSMQRVKEAVEKTKQELSKIFQSDINLPFLAADETGPKHYSITITRSQFESMINKLLQKTLLSCKKALENCKLEIKDIDEVVLVGGTCKIPRVQSAVESFFKKKTRSNINPDEVIALGAAIYGYGMDNVDYQKFRIDHHVPVSIGVEIEEGLYDPVMYAFELLPVRKVVKYSVEQDGQDQICFRIYQGERIFAKDNFLLGQFVIDNLPKRDRGVVEVQLTFEATKDDVLVITSEIVKPYMEESRKFFVTRVSGKFRKDIIVDYYQQKQVEYQQEDVNKVNEVLRQRPLNIQIYRMQKQLEDYGYKYKDQTRYMMRSYIEYAKYLKKYGGTFRSWIFSYKMDRFFNSLQAEEYMYNNFNSVIDPLRRYNNDYRDPDLTIIQEQKKINERNQFYTSLDSHFKNFEQAQTEYQKMIERLQLKNEEKKIKEREEENRKLKEYIQEQKLKKQKRKEEKQKKKNEQKEQNDDEQLKTNLHIQYLLFHLC